MAGEGPGLTDPADGEQRAAKRRKRKAWLSALLLGMMVLAVLAAYVVGKLVQSHLENSRASREAVIFPGPATQPQWHPGAGADAASNPLAAIGLAVLDADPHNVPAPAGATRRDAFQRRVGDEVQQQARYDVSGTATRVADHYTRTLEGMGFQRVKDGAGPTGRRTLVFSRGAVVATVGLRTNLKEAKMVTVVLTVVVPAARASSQ